jgi:hypothetical protein
LIPDVICFFCCSLAASARYSIERPTFSDLATYWRASHLSIALKSIQQYSFATDPDSRSQLFSDFFASVYPTQSNRLNTRFHHLAINPAERIPAPRMLLSNQGAAFHRGSPDNFFLARKRRITVKLDFRFCSSSI